MNQLPRCPIGTGSGPVTAGWFGWVLVLVGFGAWLAMVPSGFGAEAARSMVRQPMPKLPPEMVRPEPRKLDFFFIAESAERKDIVSVKLTFNLKNQPADERFTEHERLLRDEIYHFLISCRPQRNTLRHWQPFIQKELPDQLKNRHPDLDLGAVLVEQFERL